MTEKKILSGISTALPAAAVLLLVVFARERASAQLFDNLRALDNRLEISSEVPVLGVAGRTVGGPKGIASADFDGDGRADLATANIDGSVTVYFGEGNGEFSEEFTLATGTLTLRDIEESAPGRQGRGGE